MQLSYIWLLYMLQFIFMHAIILLSLSAIPMAAIAQDQQYNIHMNQFAFKNSINELGRIFNTEISFAGYIENLSNDELTLDLDQASLEIAVKEALKKANIQNYALVWNKGNNALQIWIFPSASNIMTIISGANHDNEFPHVLNLAQMQQLEPDDDLKNIPLTPGQLQQLDPYEDDQEIKKRLNKEQMQRLDKEEQENKAKTLSKEQMQKITPYKEAENNQNKTLTTEQMHNLDPDENP